MEFEWDKNKAKENIKRHEDITFEEAFTVFYDDFAIEKYDKAHSDSDERRFVRIGYSTKRLLWVCYTIRKDENGNEVIRIISARKADSEERELYLDGRRLGKI